MVTDQLVQYGCKLLCELGLYGVLAFSCPQLIPSCTVGKLGERVLGGRGVAGRQLIKQSVLREPVLMPKKALDTVGLFISVFCFARI